MAKKEVLTQKKGNAADAAPAKRAPVDWERIEPAFRAGMKSVLQIAADYEQATGRKISHTAINKHFKELGITRDLKAKVRAKAEAMVSAATVSGKVAVETSATDAVIINANADVMATVMLSQRNDIRRSRTLAMKLLEELEDQTLGRELYQQLGMLMYSPDENGKDKLNELYHKVISSAGRIDSMKKLSDTLKTLVGLEREAYGIGDDSKGQGTLEDFLDGL